HKMGIDYYGDNLKDLNANYCIDSDSILKILKNGVVNKFWYNAFKFIIKEPFRYAQRSS